MPRLPIFAAALLIAALPAIAQDGSMRLVYNAADEQEEQDAITIAANQVVFEREAGVTTFSGGVTVSQEGLEISSDIVKVFAVEDRISEIDYLRATGNLRIKSDGGTATAEAGEYTVATKIIVLTGDVVFRTEDSTISGDFLTYNINTGESRMTGSASAEIDTSSE